MPQTHRKTRDSYWYPSNDVWSYVMLLGILIIMDGEKRGLKNLQTCEFHVLQFRESVLQCSFKIAIIMRDHWTSSLLREYMWAIIIYALMWYLWFGLCWSDGAPIRPFEGIEAQLCCEINKEFLSIFYIAPIAFVLFLGARVLEGRFFEEG